VATLEAAGLHTLPYHATVPSFGVWGFVLAAAQPIADPAPMPQGLRFLDAAAHAALFAWPNDMARVPAEINRLDDQVLVRYYTEEWSALQ
jgi:spermidine synthase